VNRGQIPEIWSVAVNSTEAVQRTLGLNHQVTVKHLLTNPYDRAHRIRAVLLLLLRGEERILLPDDDLELEPDDQLLFAGAANAQRYLSLTMDDQDVLNYVRSGTEVGSGRASRWPRAGRPARKG
jgi:uncharacterized protein with PhoU and TrkA domain